jgi:hypothetical protein
VASEGVTLARIAVDGGVWPAGKRCLDLSLRRLRNELVLLGQMHQQRRIEPLDLAQIFLCVAPVIGDRGVVWPSCPSAPPRLPSTAIASAA